MSNYYGRPDQPSMACEPCKPDPKKMIKDTEEKILQLRQFFTVLISNFHSDHAVFVGGECAREILYCEARLQELKKKGANKK